MNYTHTQFGSIILAGTVPALITAAISIFLKGTIHLIDGVIVCVLVLVLLLFHSLTTEVDRGELSCRFGFGIIRRRFVLSEVVEARSVRNPWYAGWGIRWLPGHYLLWGVSGFRAVELITKDGNRFRIGTDEPEMLIQAIQAHRTMRITFQQGQIFRKGL